MTSELYRNGAAWVAVPLVFFAGIWGLCARPTEPETPRSVSVQPPTEHPHPITAEHQRLRRERALLAQLDRAIDFHDGRELRELLDRYRREFPEDEQRLQAGYGVIAACLNAPGSNSRVAAASFYAQQRGSSLRRWVRRVCLESGERPTTPSPSVALR